MKVRSVFDLVQDAREVVEYFEGVGTVEQMISKLERLKNKPEAAELLSSMESLKLSTDSLLDDMLEMSGRTVDDEDEDDDEFSEEDLRDLGLSEEEKPEEEPSSKEKA